MLLVSRTLPKLAQLLLTPRMQLAVQSTIPATESCSSKLPGGPLGATPAKETKGGGDNQESSTSTS